MVFTDQVSMDLAAAPPSCVNLNVVSVADAACSDGGCKETSVVETAAEDTILDNEYPSADSEDADRVADAHDSENAITLNIIGEEADYVFHQEAPTNARPTGFVLTSTSEVAWFIDPDCETMDELPATRSAVVDLINLLPSAPAANHNNNNNNFDVDDLFQHVFRPMSKFRKKQLMKRQCRPYFQPLSFTLIYSALYGVWVIAVIKALDYWDARMNLNPGTVVLIAYVCGVVYTVGGMYILPRCCQPDFDGENIFLIVDLYHSQAMERGINMRFLWNHVGPVDPAHPNNNRYRGMAIVFCRQCNDDEPAAIVEESSFVSAAADKREQTPPTVAADAYVVDHCDQDSCNLTVSSSQSSSSQSSPSSSAVFTV